MRELTSTDFESHKSATGVNLVDFWAPWCGPCVAMNPVLAAAERDVPSASFAKLNVDENPDVVTALGIRSIPTIMIFRDGEMRHQFSGFTSKEKLVAALLDATTTTTVVIPEPIAGK